MAKIDKRVPCEIFFVAGESRHHCIKDNNHFDLCTKEKTTKFRDKKNTCSVGIDRQIRGRERDL